MHAFVRSVLGQPWHKGQGFRAVNFIGRWSFTPGIHPDQRVLLPFPQSTDKLDKPTTSAALGARQPVPVTTLAIEPAGALVCGRRQRA